MFSRRFKVNFTPSIYTMVLAGVSLAVSAQTTSLKNSSIEGFSDLERVKQSSELNPKILQKLENFRPADFATLPGKLSRLTLNTEFEREGEIIRKGTEVVESAKGHPGYYMVKRKESSVKSDRDLYTSQVIFFLNFWEVAGRYRTDWKARVGSDFIYDVTGYVTELSLPSRFENALIGGVSWNYELIYETEASVIKSVETRKSGNLKYVVEECRNGQEVPASDLYFKLTGKMIVIQCQSKVAAIGNYSKFAYLRDYGFFIPIERRTRLNSSTPALTSISYKITDIEFDPTITKSN